jgi:aspartate racemase
VSQALSHPPSELPPLTGVLGVLGGMGPLATANFYQRLVEATPSTCDQGHIPVVIWGDPTVPDRSAALTQPGAPDPTPWLLRGARMLDALGVALIAVPCNSAHPFLSEIQRSIDAPVVDMVKATVQCAAAQFGSTGQVAVLSTEGTYRTGIYQGLLRAEGIQPIPLTVQTRQLIQSAITEIKAGRVDVAQIQVRKALAHLGPHHPDLVIAACTELTTMRDTIAADYPVLDSATVLANSAVATLRGAATLSEQGMPEAASQP